MSPIVKRCYDLKTLADAAENVATASNGDAAISSEVDLGLAVLFEALEASGWV